MICHRAGLPTLAHDNLTEYYFGKGLQGKEKDRNFQAFYHFFRDVENEFGVFFPIIVWDRNWTISGFSDYVEKLSREPWRSLAVGRERMTQGLEWFPIYAVAVVLAASLAIVPYTAPVGVILLPISVYFALKKSVRLWLLKRRILGIERALSTRKKA